MFAAALLMLVLLAVPVSVLRAAPGDAAHFDGVLADGARYLIDVPAGWNGTLVLYSHGYVSRGGQPAAATDAPDARSKAWLLANGFALAGSSYAAAGWAVAEALTDQLDVLGQFDRLTSRSPRRTIAWGFSMGGLITAALVERNPRRFAGGLPMCGVVAGSTPFLSSRFDLLFAFKTLLAPSTALHITAIGDADSDARTAVALLDAAQKTPEGRARIALVADIAQIPGWYGRLQPSPAANDMDARELGQYQWLQTVGVSRFAFDAAAEIEMRAKGNPSANTGVDYGRVFARSRDRAEVEALYTLAGADLAADLRMLDAAPRVRADPAATQYTQRFADLVGNITVPVLSMHTIADGLVPVGDESAYTALVSAAGKAPLLRDAFVQRSGHCAFTPGETIAAFQTLIARVDGGSWDARPATPTALNATAAQLGPELNALAGPRDTTIPTAPAFVLFEPPAFPR